LFNLTSSRQFKGSNNAGIYCFTNCGPVFNANGYYFELYARESFNGDKNCDSSVNQPGFGIGRDADGNNLLTDKKGEYFTITELEVWQIINIENLVLQEPVEVKIVKQSGCKNQ
jgi:hypothetical protein